MNIIFTYIDINFALTLFSLLRILFLHSYCAVMVNNASVAIPKPSIPLRLEVLLRRHLSLMLLLHQDCVLYLRNMFQLHMVGVLNRNILMT